MDADSPLPKKSKKEPTNKKTASNPSDPSAKEIDALKHSRLPKTSATPTGKQEGEIPDAKKSSKGKKKSQVTDIANTGTNEIQAPKASKKGSKTALAEVETTEDKPKHDKRKAKPDMVENTKGKTKRSRK